MIHALRRKPQASARSVYRDSLLPREEHAEAWARLSEALPQKDACRRMVALLALAQDEGCEAELAHLIAEDLDAGKTPDARDLRDRLEPRGRGLPADIPVALPCARALRRPAGGRRMTGREIDVHTLPTMLAALRLPSFTTRWQGFAEQADAEG